MCSRFASFAACFFFRPLPAPTPPDEAMHLWFEVDHGLVHVRDRDWPAHNRTDCLHVTDEYGTLIYDVPPGATMELVIRATEIHIRRLENRVIDVTVDAAEPVSARVHIVFGVWIYDGESTYFQVRARTNLNVNARRRGGWEGSFL